MKNLYIWAEGLDKMEENANEKILSTKDVKVETATINKTTYEQIINILTLIWAGLSLILGYLSLSASMDGINGFDKAAADFNILGKIIMLFTFSMAIAGFLTIPMLIVSLFIKNRISSLMLWGKRLLKSIIYTVLLIIVLLVENFIANLIFVSEKGLI